MQSRSSWWERIVCQLQSRSRTWGAAGRRRADAEELRQGRPEPAACGGNGGGNAASVFPSLEFVKTHNTHTHTLGIRSFKCRSLFAAAAADKWPGAGRPGAQAHPARQARAARPAPQESARHSSPPPQMAAQSITATQDGHARAHMEKFYGPPGAMPSSAKGFLPTSASPAARSASSATPPPPRDAAIRSSCPSLF